MQQEKPALENKNETIGKKLESSIVVKCVDQHANDNQRDKAFVTATKKVAKLCYPHLWLTTKSRKVTDLLESGELFSSKEVIKEFKLKVRKLTSAVFAPEKVLKKVDLSPIGGGLNFLYFVCSRSRASKL